MNKSVNIYLDIGGVLNIVSPLYSSYNYDALGKKPIEYHLMYNLEKMIQVLESYRYDVNIIISSSWSIDTAIGKLSKLRFKYIKLISSHIGFGKEKSELISEHIFESSSVNNIVIDSENIELDNNIVFIETNMEVGLTTSGSMSALSELIPSFKKNMYPYIGMNRYLITSNNENIESIAREGFVFKVSQKLNNPRYCYDYILVKAKDCKVNATMIDGTVARIDESEIKIELIESRILEGEPDGMG